MKLAPSAIVVNALCLLSMALVAPWVRAQEGDIPPLSTERPSAGASVDLVPAGSLQVENGLNFAVQRGQYVADLPENFIRYGLGKHVEVRFQSSNMVYRSASAPGDPVFESQDLGVSVKVGNDFKTPLAPKALILCLGLPTGGKDMTTSSYDPTVALLWAQAAHGFTLLEEAQATFTTLEGARRPLWAPGISLGRALSPALGVFVEYAPSVLPDSSLTHVIDGGFTLSRNGLRQFDIRTGYLKDANGIHTLLSVGYSIRRDHFIGRGRKL